MSLISLLGLLLPSEASLPWLWPILFSLWKQFWCREQSELTSNQINCHPCCCLFPLAKPHICYPRAPETEIITQETCLLCWAGTCCQCPLSLHPCFQAGGQMTESSLSCVLSAYGICLGKCEVQFQCVCSFETTFLHILNLNMDWIGYTVGLEVWNRPWFHFQISLPPINISVVSEMNLICKN